MRSMNENVVALKSFFISNTDQNTKHFISFRYIRRIYDENGL